MKETHTHYVIAPSPCLALQGSGVGPGYSGHMRHLWMWPPPGGRRQADAAKGRQALDKSVLGGNIFLVLY